MHTKFSYKLWLSIFWGVCIVALAVFFVASQQVLAGKVVSPVGDRQLSDMFDPFLQMHRDGFRIQAVTQQTNLSTDLTENSYIAVDFTTGNTILSKNTSQKVPIASLTKIMSAMVALDLMSAQETITVSKYASLMPPTKIGISAGEKLTLDELLHGMLMTSANDAAQAVADGVNSKYQQNIFVWAMNRKAQLLGLKYTHFSNPQGFDNTQNYSTASDLAILSHYALTYYPEIARIVQEDYVQLPASSLHKQYDLYNWNGLLDVYPNVSGIKIGNTTAAKYTNIVVSQRENKEILVVMLGASGVLQRDLDAATLLDDAYQQEYALSPVGVNETMLMQKYQTWKYWN